ncbi:MAG TPA: amidohydrolase family protein [Alphaproteobacteria bacterium]|nr:amidohydrolase family protein [Alphaproteobacteria bacterium]
MAAFDCVIRGGTVVDGSGGKPFEADVAVSQGRIAQVGKVSGAGTEEIDAKGKLVTPGFVDIHTHYDGQAIWSSRLVPSSAHGVTTVVMGNCGVGFAPCRKDDHELLIAVMEGVEDIPGVVMAEGLSWEWETFPDYLNALDARKRDIDVAAYLPHSPLRVYAMGRRGADREPATEADLARMKALSREAMEAGALGFATSRLFIHRTRDGDSIPSYDASETELSAIAQGMREAGKGIIQMVMNARQRSWTEEIGVLTRLTAESGRPGTFTLGTSNEPSDDWKVALRAIDEANRTGPGITAQVFPRPIGMILGHNLSVNPFSLCPSYQPLKALSFADRAAALKNPELKRKLVSEEPGQSASMLAIIGRNWEYMFEVTDPPNYEPAPETSIAAQARARGVKPEEIAYELLMKNDGAQMLIVALGNLQGGSLEVCRQMLLDKDTVIGLGDGGAHYGMICDASFPTHLLTHWTRDRKGERLPLEWAIKALARDPAKAVGFEDRGLLARGYTANLNIIDYDRLALHTPEILFDLPAGGRRLNQRADGYALTMVGGRIIYRGGAPTGDLPGKLLRGAQPAPTH